MYARKLGLFAVTLTFLCSCKTTLDKPDAQNDSDAWRGAMVSWNALLDSPRHDRSLRPGDRTDYLLRANGAIAGALCTPVPNSKCDEVVGNVRVVLFGEGDYQVEENECYRLHEDSSYDMLVLQGAGRKKTTLHFNEAWGRSCNGLAVYAREGKGMIVTRDLEMIGHYAPRDSDGQLNDFGDYDTSNDDDIRGIWQKAFWSRGQGTHMHVENVDVKGFYYAYAVADLATFFVYEASAYESGDGGFLAYSGGRMLAARTRSSWSADLGRGLGFGYVAETLHYQRDTPKCGADGEGKAVKRWRDADYYECIKMLVDQKSMGERTLLEVYDSVADNNLKGGFFANMGAVVLTWRSTAFNHNFVGPDGKPFIELDDADAYRPNVPRLGQFGASFGFHAQKYSILQAQDAQAFNNFFGYGATFDAEVSALRSRAWNNRYYGYHAARMGRIDARYAWAFQDGVGRQRYGFAVDVDTSMIRLDGARTVQGETVLPNFCVWDNDPCNHEVAPNRNDVNFNSPIRALSRGPFLGLFYVP